MKPSGIRINCLVTAYMRLPLNWTGKDAVITKERPSRDGQLKKVAGKKLVEPRLWNHTSYSRKHYTVLSPAYT
jgi:hypothetical protein